MPKLPTDIGYNAPQAGAAVVAPRVAPTGLTTIGQAMRKVGGEVLEKEDQLSYARAKSMLLSSQVEAYQKIDDEDFGTYKQRYEEIVGKSLQEARGLIRSARDRAMFDAESQLQMARGVDQITKKAWDMEKSIGVATLNEQLESQRRAAMDAIDNATRVQALRNSQELIQGAQQRRYLDPDQAQAMSQKAAVDYAAASVEVLPWDQQIAMLKNPKGTAAEYLPKDARDTLMKRAIAGQESDMLRAERAREVRQKELQRNAWDQLEQNGYRVDAIDQGVFLELDAERQNALLRMAESAAKGQQTVTNEKLYAQFVNIAATSPNDFIGIDLERVRDQLSDSDYRRLNELQAGVASQQSEALTKRKQLQTNKAIVDGKLREIDINPNAKEGTSDAEDAFRIRALASRAYDLFIEREGREPTNDEMLGIVNRITAEHVLEKRPFFWPDKKVRAYEADVIDLPEEIPASEYDQIVAALKRAGMPATDEYIVRMYNAGLAQ